MSTRFATVPLRSVVVPVARSVAPQPGTTYRQVGVRLWGEGAYEREPVDGGATQYATLYEARSGDIIVNKIWARNGSVAVIDDRLAGAFGSGEFPMFAPTGALLPRWVHWLTKWRPFWEQCAEKSQGTSGQNRIKPEQFLEIAIPLPPLPEQQRIVARIDELAADLLAAVNLRLSSVAETEHLFASERDRLFATTSARRVPIGDCFRLVNGRAFRPEEWSERGKKIVRIQNLKYPEASFNHFEGHVDERYVVRAGDVLFAWSGQVVSLGAHIWAGEDAILNQHIFNVRFGDELSAQFVRHGWNALVDEMKAQVRGLEMFHIRKQELVRMHFPVPTRSEQNAIVKHLDDLQKEVDALKRLQARSQAELNALLPAILDRAFAGAL